MKALLLILSLVGLSGCNLGFVSFGSKVPLGGVDIDGRRLIPAVSIDISYPDNLELGICTPITLQGRDRQDRLAYFKTTESVQVQLSGLFVGEGGAEIYRSSNCLEVAAEVTLVRGDSETIFYVRASNQSSFSISMTSALGSGRASFDITRTPQSFSYISLPGKVGGGHCSDLFTVRLEDGLGVAFENFPGNLELSGGEGSEFYTDANCTNRSDNPRVQLDGITEFYYRSTKIQDQMSLVVKLFNSSTVKPASTSISVERVPYQFVILQGPVANLELGDCSSAPFNVQLQDVEGLPIAVLPGENPINVSMNTPQGGTNGTFHDNSNCNGDESSFNFNQGEMNHTVYFRPLTFNGMILEASADGYANGFVNKDVNRSPRSIVFNTEPSADGINRSVAIGACAEYRVRIRDALNNTMPFAANMTLNQNKNLVFYSDNACNNVDANLTFAAADSQKSFYVKDTVLGQNDISVSVVPNLAGVASLNGTLTVRDALQKDLDYNAREVVTPEIRAGVNERARALIVMGGFSYVIGQSGVNGDARIGIVKLNSVGAKVADVSVALGGVESGAFAAVQQGSDILVAGFRGSDFVVARFDDTLALDGTFGTGGFRTITFGSTEVARGIALLGNGDIAIAGTVGSGGSAHMGIAILGPDGSVDEATDALIFDGGLGGHEILALAVQNLGGNDLLVLVGETNNDFLVARVEVAGSLTEDLSFSTNGYAVRTVGGGDDRARAVLVDGTQIYVGGSGDNGRLAMAQFNQNGSLNSGFRGGRFTEDFGASDGAYGLALDGGTLVVAGTGNQDLLLARYNKNTGSRESFALHRIGAAVRDILRAVVVSGGRVYGAGSNLNSASSQNTFAAVRTYP